MKARALIWRTARESQESMEVAGSLREYLEWALCN
jgi:hypothetical protein